MHLIRRFMVLVVGLIIWFIDDPRSSESWCCRIAYDQLIVDLETLYQIIITDLISIWSFLSFSFGLSADKRERDMTYPIQIPYSLV